MNLFKCAIINSTQTFKMTSLKTFSHCLKNINDIKQSISNKNSILVTGPSGVGKSTICDLILKQIFTNDNLDLLHITSDKYENLTNFKIQIENFCTFKNITFYFQSKHKIILIDDLDILFTMDRLLSSFITDLVQYKFDAIGFKFQHIPIICCANIFSVKKINDIKQYFTSVTHLKRLSTEQCFKMVIANVECDNTPDIDYEKLLQLIKLNDNDYRMTMLSIDDVKTNDVKTKDSIQLNYRKKQKYIHNNIYDMTLTFLEQPMSINDIDDVIDTQETNLLVGMIHENVIKKNMNISKDIRAYYDLCKVFSISDIWEKNAFESLDWDSLRVNNIWKLNLLNYKIHNQSTKLDINKNIKIDFSQVINRQSTALNFRKKNIHKQRTQGLDKVAFVDYMHYIETLFATNTLNTNNIESFGIHKVDLEIILKYANDFNLVDLKNKVNKFKKYFK